jgi:hypothetical protein
VANPLRVARAAREAAGVTPPASAPPAHAGKSFATAARTQRKRAH